MITFYGYKKCSTCRKAEKSLDKADTDYKFVDITETPPSKSELKRIQAQAGVPVRKLFNTSGEQYKALGLKDKVADLSEDQAFDLLSKNGRLIKRPLVTDGKSASIGFDENAFAVLWG